jgi:hypothetical protein
MKVCVPGWHRLTSRTKTSSSLKRFCPVVTLSDSVRVEIKSSQRRRKAPFFVGVSCVLPLWNWLRKPTRKVKEWLNSA